MQPVSHTLRVNTVGDQHLCRLDPDVLWSGLRAKAAQPVGFVPAITGVEILEYNAAGFIRRIEVFGQDKLRERVVFEPRKRVVFHQMDDPDLAAIVNEIGEDSDGALTLTLVVTFSEQGSRRAESDPAFAVNTQRYFAGTVKPIIAGLHAAECE